MNYTQPNVYEFISKQTNDPIVERKTCRVSGTKFAIYQSDIDFYDKISPVFNGVKYQIPTPTLCPEERQRARLLWRNERKLYRRNCDASTKEIISNYSPDKPYKVYNIDQRYNDTWNSLSFGIDIDLNQSISEHLEKVIVAIPQISLMVKMNENCNYVNGCGNSKDCYLVFDTDFCEDSYYSDIIKHSQNIVDSTHIYYCNICYNCINCTESYHLINCYECDQSKYLYNCSLCSQCEYCYGCSNLVGKKYCFNNEQLTKEQYEERLSQTGYTSFYPTPLQRAVYTVNDHGGIGNNLYGTKNCTFSHNIGFSENLKYSDLVTDCHNSYDISSFGGTTQWSVDSSSIGLDCSNIYFSNVVTAGSHHIYYSYALLGCNNCFGCSHLLNKEYCIFNKQYTKEEYEKLVPQIIAHMQDTGERGEFLSPQLSPFGYNETVANDYYPLDKEQASKLGFKRSDYDYTINIPENTAVIKAGELSDSELEKLRDDDTIINQIIICEVSGKPFRIIKQELEFYRKYDIPLPKKHPDIRHQERIKNRPGRTLYLRTCDQTGKEILSVYPADCGFLVYSEESYNKEIYS